jgi:hypothetical protein
MKMHASTALGPNPKVDRQQSMRIAKIALGYYNKKNKVTSILYSLWCSHTISPWMVSLIVMTYIHFFNTDQA